MSCIRIGLARNWINGFDVSVDHILSTAQLANRMNLSPIPAIVQSSTSTQQRYIHCLTRTQHLVYIIVAAAAIYVDHKERLNIDRLIIAGSVMKTYIFSTPPPPPLTPLLKF